MLTLYLRDQNNKLYYVTEGSSAQLNKLCKKIDKKGGQYWISKSPYLHGQLYGYNLKDFMLLAGVE